MADSKKTDEVDKKPLLAHTIEAIAGVQPAASGSPGNKSLLATLPKWWKVARLWFNCEERWKARAYAAVAVILALIRIALLVKISYNQRNFETALAERDKVAFRKSLWSFGTIIMLAAPLFALTDFVEDRLKLEWRNWLTKELLSGYYANRAFYKLHQYDSSLDNPDQRICDDVPSFTEGSSFLLIGITRKLFGVVAFSGVLWTVAPNLVLFLFAYSAIGTWLTTSVFGKRLMALTYTVLKREGDLRFNLVRTRENSESIAFYAGEVQEAHSASLRLDSLVAYVRRRVAWMAGLSLWSNFYSYATMLIPPLLTAPRYFAGEVEFGVITQVGFAFRHIEAALNYFVDNLDKFSGLGAEAERLDALLRVLQDTSEEKLRILHFRHSKPGLTLEGVTIRTPNGGQMLCQGLDLTIEKGQSVLVVGPSGCGKSSLLRAICGLWTSGTGIIHTPGVHDMFFLPQKPYMPLGTLRQQLLYPSGDNSLGLHSHRAEPMVSDLDLLELLDRVSLSGLADRVGGFDAEAEWSHILSLGEQQRVAFLRLLLHRPPLAFLDEATGAVDTVTEAALYKALQQQSQSYISVGHRKELCAFHSHVLQHMGRYTWHLSTMADYQNQRS